MKTKMIRINLTLWATAVKSFKARRQIPEVMFVHSRKPDKKDEDKVGKNEEAGGVYPGDDKK